MLWDLQGWGLLLGSCFLVPKEATLPLVLTLRLGLEVHGVANWAPAVRPTLPVAHPLGEGPAGSPTLVQEPVGAEQEQRKMLNDAVRHRETELPAVRSFLFTETLLSYSSQFMMLHRVLEPAPARAPASTIPFSPRAAAFGCLLDSSRLHALPDFKNKQAPPPPPRGARRASTSPRLPRLGSLLAGPGRDARAVTPRSRRRSLGAPRASGVRLAIALPPSVSPPVLRCSVRIALL